MNPNLKIYNSSLDNSLNVSATSRLKKTKDDFEFVEKEGKFGKTSEIGKGAFGTVRLVKDKLKGDLYAMKIVKMCKRLIFESHSMDQIKSEIQIQRKMEHPHTLKLKYFFEDDDNVYMILPYCENGNLFHYIRKNKDQPLKEEEAFIFFFQTALAIEYLHSKNIIHRDLKPENLLLDSRGNIQVSDFGWSALKSNERMRTTYCGTIDYMAPEMVSNSKYNEKVDIWSLGVLLYEMTQKSAPFKGANQAEKNKNILSCKIADYQYPISNECQDLIRMILVTKADQRPSFDDIYESEFVKKYVAKFKINLDKLRSTKRPRSKSRRETNMLDAVLEEPERENRQNFKIEVTDPSGAKSQIDNDLRIDGEYLNEEEEEDTNFAAPSEVDVKIPDFQAKMGSNKPKLQAKKTNELNSAIESLGIEDDQELNFFDDIGSIVEGGKRKKRSRRSSRSISRFGDKEEKREARSKSRNESNISNEADINSIQMEQPKIPSFSQNKKKDKQIFQTSKKDDEISEVHIPKYRPKSPERYINESGAQKKRQYEDLNQGEINSLQDSTILGAHKKFNMRQDKPSNAPLKQPVQEESFDQLDFNEEDDEVDNLNDIYNNTEDIFSSRFRMNTSDNLYTSRFNNFDSKQVQKSSSLSNVGNQTQNRVNMTNRQASEWLKSQNDPALQFYFFYIKQS